MKKTFLKIGVISVTLGLILILSSCSSSDDNPGNLTITPSDQTIEVGGSVTFKVFYGPEDVTARASIVNTSDGNSVVSNATFTPSAAGNYNFTATYDGKSAATSVTVNKAASSEPLYYRKVAILYFTTDWCYNCPPERRNISELQSTMEGRIEVITIHGDDDWVNLGIPEGRQIMNKYDIKVYPTAFFDLRKSTIGSTIPILKSYVNQSIDNYPAQAGIAIETTNSGRTINVKVKVKAELENDYSLFVTLLEDGIIGRQEDISVSGSTVLNYSHDNTLRAIQPSANGEALGVISAGQEVVKEYTFTAGADVNLEKAYITAYIVINDKNGYINNVNSCPVGKSVGYLYNE